MTFITKVKILSVVLKWRHFCLIWACVVNANIVGGMALAGKGWTGDSLSSALSQALQVEKGGNPRDSCATSSRIKRMC